MYFKVLLGFRGFRHTSKYCNNNNTHITRMISKSFSDVTSEMRFVSYVSVCRTRTYNASHIYVLKRRQSPTLTNQNISHIFSMSWCSNLSFFLILLSLFHWLAATNTICDVYGACVVSVLQVNFILKCEAFHVCIDWPRTNNANFKVPYHTRLMLSDGNIKRAGGRH